MARHHDSKDPMAWKSPAASCPASDWRVLDCFTVRLYIDSSFATTALLFLTKFFSLFVSSLVFPPQPHRLETTFLFFSSAGEVSGILFCPSINVPILYQVRIKTNKNVTSKIVPKFAWCLLTFSDTQGRTQTKERR